MSDYEETTRLVREGELKHSIDEMRSVRHEDGRNTIHEIQIRGEFGEWGSLSVGLARRRKGDRRDQALGGALSLYRALVNLTERHRKEFAKRWPEHFPKSDTVSGVTHHQVVSRLQWKAWEAKVAARRAADRNAKALELLEKAVPFDLEATNDAVMAARRALRGDDGDA